MAYTISEESHPTHVRSRAQTAPVANSDSQPVTGMRPGSFYARFGKRLFELALILATLPIWLPVILVVWLAIVLDGGHGLYSQLRVGRDGRLFRCWKFRTMVPDADAALQELLAQDPERAEEWARDQKLEDDPRITRLGHGLRRMSIDELPQLWNVLRGDMALVGPRPFTPDQKALYDDCPRAAAYYGLRPGITGLWQVECRNASAFAERAQYDARYARDLSLALDLRIILKTLAVMLRGTGR